ncbi:tetratricopeptide repeat protein [Streptomyces cinereospinus]|uniref:Tetratricopeptide repeat protein n=1 Tax=Streptomyces cinereospinus TaxID=285561 RepID=A0ABV5MY33_9ACTN
MGRAGRDKKREQQHRTAGAVIDVRVPGPEQGAGGASIGGVPVGPVPGEELQRTVLNHLHRIALATGRPVLATVHDERIGYVVPLQVHPDGSSCFTSEPVRTDSAPEAVPVPPPPSPPAPADPAPAGRDSATHVLRTSPEPGARSTPAFRPGAVDEPQPLGEFGPPPVMDARWHPKPPSTPEPEPEPAPEADPDPKPTPPRGFDAVAEAILAPADAPSPAPVLLAGPTARIGEAVQAGRIGTAAALAEQALAEASATLPADHPELLRLIELTAYVAYLAADPVRAFRLSVGAARVHHRGHDAESAYGTVQSAATAWRAVRDPALGLELGHELIALWSELAAQAGPAADDAEELASARARMDRLTRRAGGTPGT